MKKIGILSILVLCLVLTGCGKRKLVCSYKSYNSYYGSDEVLAKFTFKKDDTIDKYVINEKVTYTDEYLKQNNTTIKEQYQTAVDYCKNSVPNNKKIECKATQYKDSITVVIEYKLSEMTDKDVESLNISDYIKSKYDDIKKQYAEQGFTCK